MNLEHLVRPFSSDQVKQRTTPLGYTVDYIETPTVITRMNEAFQGEWSFKILDHKLLEDVVVVLGELTAGGITKQQFGTCELSHEGEEGVLFSLGDGMKAAASDALKKCATLFGLGLQLYGVTPDTFLEGTTQTDAVDQTPAQEISLTPSEEVVEPEPLTQATPEPVVDASPGPDPIPAVAPADDTVTDIQFAEIIELAKGRNFSQAQVDQRARSRYGKALVDLTQWEADEIIAKLKGN
ncbi:MAG: Rad52/Rad22 family DNA repair protein [Gemmatimonadota bacterium]|nr:Rad52/Rad22 family DNA repair protein [Gemmatimonadota bacterium]